MKQCVHCHGDVESFGGLSYNDRTGEKIVIDVCRDCQLLWLDTGEEMLAQKSLLVVAEKIVEWIKPGVEIDANVCACPVCAEKLARIEDKYTENQSVYFLCPNDHGMLISFADFLRFK